MNWDFIIPVPWLYYISTVKMFLSCPVSKLKIKTLKMNNKKLDISTAVSSPVTFTVYSICSTISKVIREQIKYCLQFIDASIFLLQAGYVSNTVKMLCKSYKQK